MTASRLTPEARRDFRDAVRFYRSRDPEVAVRFAETVRAAIRFAVDNPVTPPVRHGYHTLVLRRPFPYSLWYQVEADVVVVAAVWAHARNPAELTRRLGAD